MTRRFFSANPVVLQIGSTVFAHGGVLPQHVEYGIARINQVGGRQFRCVWGGHVVTGERAKESGRAGDTRVDAGEQDQDASLSEGERRCGLDAQVLAREPGALPVQPPQVILRAKGEGDTRDCASGP